MTKKYIHPWLVVLGAICIQISIGAIYSWSLFNQPLMDQFNWTKNQVILTFSIAIFTFAFSTIFSGKLQDKLGPKIVATIGGLLYGGGLTLASFSTTIIELYIYYGIIAGAGVGFAYVCPLSTCVKWFPHKKGFITGITVGAFGMGSLLFKSIIESFLLSYGISNTFLYLGIIYTTLVLIGAQFLVLPPKNHAPISETIQSIDINNFSVQQMLHTKSFYLLWIMYFFACVSGLLVISLAKDIGIQLANLPSSVAAYAVALIGLFNAGGRVIWGSLSDKLGRIKIVFIMFIITSVCMIMMSFIPLNFILFFIFISGIAFCFGGFLSVFPTITSDFYGIKNFGANYGIMYQAYGLAALAGPFIIQSSGGLKPTFIISSILSIIGGCITFMVKPSSFIKPLK
ncbi:L-lactate MFS transporter [Inediibacterium massiliense]|uniref:L-lactate MFS transporter n=1 Tax=Inediibacterium massiliense TaxID=1658111 RepID=UPI0006B53DA1|nr:OFA family MFS transporter [Inediibacterium massiliense]